MADIAGLSVKLGLVTVEWDAATEKAKRQAKDLRAAFDNLGVGFSKAAQLWQQFGSVLTLGGITALAAETVQFADDIVDLGNSFELTTQEVLAFRDAITSAGGKADGAAKVLSTLYAKIDEGRQGNDKTIAQFEKLGITFGDLQKMNTYEAINKVAKGFSNIADAFERAKMIKEFFGKGGIGVSIDQINSALAQGTKRYDEYADGIKAVGVISDNVKRSMDNLKIAIANMMKPFAVDGIVSIQRFEQILKALAAGGIALGIGKIAVAFVELGIAIRAAVAAGAAFNLAMGVTSPLGLAMKLLAVGATAIVFFASQQDNEAKIAQMYNDNPSVKDKLAKDAQSRLLFTKEPSAAGASASSPSTQANPEVQARAAQVNLARQLQDIDARRNKVNAEAVTVGETLTKLAMLDLQLEEKRAQIEAKRTQDLLGAKDNTAAYSGQINALADIELRTTEQNIEAQKQLAMADITRLNAKEQAAHTLRGIEMSQYEESTKAAEANKAERTAALYQMGKMTDEQIRLNELANDRTNYESKLVMYGNEKRTTLLELYDLEAKITEFTREQSRLGQDPEMIKERAQAIRDVGMATINLRIEAQNTQQTWQYGWAQAFNNFVENSTNAAMVAQQQFNVFTNNISSAIDNFVRTGKFSFKDFARSVIQDLIAIQMKMQAMAMFRMALASVGFHVDSPVTSAYGGGTPGVVGYANGGEPPVGRASLVGENGPELFVPKSAGTIIPNNQLSSVMGGGPTVNYNGPYIANMSSIDTQSAVQFLSKNKSAVWAANQSAQRSFPMSK